MMMNKLKEIRRQEKREFRRELILELLGFVAFGCIGYILTCLAFCL